MPDPDPIAEIFELFDRFGSSPYDEAVSMTEHCLQTAVGAIDDGAEDILVAAALLHDIGHLLLARERESEDFLAADWDHETVGADWVRPVFGNAVAGPVALHVDAKRFLCGTESSYGELLSPASVASLAVQGGPFDWEQAARFEASAYSTDAVALRWWDDAGKVAGRVVPTLASFEELLRSLRS